MKTVTDRFEEKFIPEPNSGCWLWEGGIGSSGYAQFWFNGKTVQSSRMAYELYKGRLSPKDYVCHTCDNKSCVNPDHLFIGTAQDNMTDKVRKGRHVFHESHPNSKLSYVDVARIRDLLATGNDSHAEIALKFGVSRMTITDINNNRTWI
jgi:hypothetical protein